MLFVGGKRERESEVEEKKINRVKRFLIFSWWLREKKRSNEKMPSQEREASFLTPSLSFLSREREEKEEE